MEKKTFRPKKLKNYDDCNQKYVKYYQNENFI